MPRVSAERIKEKKYQSAQYRRKVIIEAEKKGLPGVNLTSFNTIEDAKKFDLETSEVITLQTQVDGYNMSQQPGQPATYHNKFETTLIDAPITNESEIIKKIKTETTIRPIVKRYIAKEDIANWLSTCRETPDPRPLRIGGIDYEHRSESWRLRYHLKPRE